MKNRAFPVNSGLLLESVTFLCPPGRITSVPRDHSLQKSYLLQFAQTRTHWRHLLYVSWVVSRRCIEFINLPTISYSTFLIFWSVLNRYYLTISQTQDPQFLSTPKRAWINGFIWSLMPKQKNQNWYRNNSNVLANFCNHFDRIIDSFEKKWYSCEYFMELLRTK